MYIKEYESFKFENNKYCFFKKTNDQTHLFFLSMFLWDTLYYFFRMEPQAFIQSLDNFNSDGQAFEFVEIDIDHEKKLIYLSEPYDDLIKKIIDKSEKNFYTITPKLTLCQKQIIKHVVITQENFIKIILLWTKIWNTKAPFILLYLDGKNSYEVLPFETQQAMEDFVAVHTQQENKN